jgi:hypothetical protein
MAKFKCDLCDDNAVCVVRYYGGYEEVTQAILCEDHTAKAEREDDWLDTRDLELN